ncbi:DNA-binding heavy metal response regulator [hydrothermal vent metagenome]|uniref:DNA-binding heavy metal response regulator n=1 Tax=hydrothermal vent metagenome TaxID=652676 RepID=A0A3B0T4U3_9ZZZZ
MTSIGSLNEKPLHFDLKEWYRRDGDLVEAPIEGFVVDLVRDGLLIEIQTRGFAAMRKKFDRLLDSYPILLVHPVAVKKWIVKLDEEGNETSRKRSPKHGIAADVCAELVSFPSLLSHPNFTLEVALIEEEEIRKPDAKKGWRRGGYVIEERRLIGVIDTVGMRSPAALLGLLPANLPDPFTTADLADGLGRSRHLAREVGYCLRLSGAVETVGRDKRGILYRLP